MTHELHPIDPRPAAWPALAGSHVVSTASGLVGGLVNRRVLYGTVGFDVGYNGVDPGGPNARWWVMSDLSALPETIRDEVRRTYWAVAWEPAHRLLVDMTGYNGRVRRLWEEHTGATPYQDGEFRRALEAERDRAMREEIIAKAKADFLRPSPTPTGSRPYAAAVDAAIGMFRMQHKLTGKTPAVRVNRATFDALRKEFAAPPFSAEFVEPPTQVHAPPPPPSVNAFLPMYAMAPRVAAWFRGVPVVVDESTTAPVLVVEASGAPETALQYTVRG